MAADRTVLFYDDRNKLSAAQQKFAAEEYRFVTDVPTAEELRACEGGTVILMLANGSLQRATAACRELRDTRVLVLPGGAGNGTEPVAADCSKPRLDYMETEITRVCNLNCRGCCDFINLKVREEPYYDYNRFCADLARLKELFWGIAKIRLMGGEPLLNPRVADYAEKARGIFPDSDLRIVTNGLLVPSLSAETLLRIKNANCSFDISSYPPTLKRKKEIVSVLNGAGVQYNFSVPMLFFFRNILEHPVADPVPAHKNCIFSHCHMLGDGRLAPCSFAYCIYRFNRHFHTAYTETDCVDIYDPAADGWQILPRLSGPHEFCKNCGGGMTPLRWKGGCAPEQARREDWLIKDGFFGTGVAPVVQRAAKKGAVLLRGKLQSKQGD